MFPISYFWLMFIVNNYFHDVNVDAIFVPYNNSNIRYIGRFDQGPNGARFDWNGCEIRVIVQGSSTVTAKLSQEHQNKFQPNAFLVYIDGVPQNTPVSGSQCTSCTFDTHLVKNNSVYEYPIASNLSPGSHEIRIFKSTEPDYNGRPNIVDNFPNYMTFYGLVLDDGKVLEPKTPSQRRIEFIGDSITAGYCNLCQGPTIVSDESGNELGVGTAFGQESFARSWPTEICEELKAECHSGAWSGIGMIHNCCGGDLTMPPIWKRTLATDPSSVWDFSRWIPDALVINLGTNDGGSARDPKYVETYLSLVMNASHAYGPHLNVFLACGPMSNAYCPYINQVITQATKAGVKAHLLDQTPFLNGTFGPACCGHPGTKVDTAMAKAGADVIGSILNW